MNPPVPKGVKLRLIVLKQGFDPEPTMKGAAFARRLGELGFDVEVVTGFPNYPGGKIYDGYRVRPIRRMVMQGVPVTRLALYPSHDQNRIGRVLNYVSFFLSAALYLIFFARRADVIYAYHPPLTVAMAAELAGFVRRTPVVLDVQDMWPDTLRATGMISNVRLLRVVGRICRWTWWRAAHIMVLSNGFRRLLVERGVPEERITVVPNWADEEAVAAGSKLPDLLTESGKFRVLFAGNMGLAQGLDTVLDAAAFLVRERPEVEFCFLGSGLEMARLEARVANEGLFNVRFLPRVPMAEVGAFLAAADCLLVHLKADPLFAITIPSKTQAYMAAGKPIIMAVEGDAAELVHQSRGGVVVPPEDAQALAEAVSGLADLAPDDLAELGANAHRFYKSHLSFEQGTCSLAAVLSNIARKGK
ncbi:glycosyltransferase (plasmid) [Sphingobium yanoikuyae]|uniref:Glycosyltransferase n=1 Tax=Sphingobium yanoikuyae TaxID=13690 RepID=A0A6P1GQJ3_SPHYA|nr:glycosyltransferase family 4 protein [Sphingobium yanoikuyae]QHD70728.1 glycosyltransferase [Sphingobium yanoikuyae]